MQATTITQVSPAPVLPQPLAAGTPQPAAPVVAAFPGVPTTAAEVAALKARRSELSNQLESAAGRRQRLSASLAGKEGADRAGIEARIAVLDQRIMQLESDLSTSGHQLVMAPGTLVATTEPAGQFRIEPGIAAGLSMVLIIFVLAPIAFAAARMMWKRASTRATPPPELSGDAARRLERLEQGMDAIAVEIERVSEGQRFVTRLLSEGHVVSGIREEEPAALHPRP